MAKQYALASLASEYRTLWDSIVVKDTARAGAEARAVIASKQAYQHVERETGVPWFIVGALHRREAAGSFSRWLHNGDPMRDKAGRPLRTVNVPAGRPPDPSVDWYAGAYDALVTLKHYDQIKSWGAEHVAYAAESFNGFGYRNPSINIPSPYLWGGTNHQKPGKYVRDHVFDPKAWDSQIGVMAILKMIMQLDASAVLNKPTVPSVPAPKPTPQPRGTNSSPKATEGKDAIRPAGRSRTIWATLGGYVSSIGGLAVGAFQSLNNPYALAAFLFVFVVVTVAAVFVFLNYRKIVALVHHLTPDDGDDDADDGVTIVGEHEA